MHVAQEMLLYLGSRHCTKAEVQQCNSNAAANRSMQTMGGKNVYANDGSVGFMQLRSSTLKTDLKWGNTETSMGCGVFFFFLIEFVHVWT